MYIVQYHLSHVSQQYHVAPASCLVSYELIVGHELVVYS